MNPKLLLVSTQHPDEKILLQQQYSLKNDCFIVPSTETQTLESLVRSICYEYSGDSPSTLVQKLKEFAFSCMKMTFSLTLFRQITQVVCKTQQTLKQFKHHFLQIGTVLSDDEEEESSIPAEQSFSRAQEKDHLFQLAEKGEIRLTRLLDQQQLQLPDQQCFKFTQTKVETVRTQQTITRVFIPPNPEQRTSEKQQAQDKFPSFFYSAETNSNHNQAWWKAQKGNSQQSRELSKFDKRGTNVISQKSITQLVIDEMKRDLNREIELGKEVRKHQNNETYKFNKIMKGKLMNAKLKKKGRRL